MKLKGLLSIFFGLCAAAFSVQAQTYVQRINPGADMTLYVNQAAPCSPNAYFYVPPPGTNIIAIACGDDVLGDGSTARPFATAARAHEEFATKYDFQFKYRPIIQLAAGSAGNQVYHAPGLLISGPLIGQAGTVPPLNFIKPGSSPPVVESLKIGKYVPYTLRGDPGNPTGAFCYGNAATVHLPCVSLSDGAGLRVEGITVNTQGYDQDCIDVFNHSFLDLNNVWFGYCGYPNFFLGVGVAESSNVMATGTITVTGALTAFMQIADGGHFLPNSDGGSPLILFNILGSPVMQQGLFVIDHATVYARFAFSGAPTGSKALVVRGGVLFTGTGCGTGVPGTAPTIEAGSVCN